jgi:5-(carboxyamino)imidazole ribonucleotide synthase
MVNIVGNEPDLAELLAVSGARVHRYGKAPRSGRKLGHVTLVAPGDGDLSGPLGRVRALADLAWET